MRDESDLTPPSTATAATRTSVAIVGGGPVGLSLALVLARFDIACIVLERDSSTTQHPKARGCNPRTMELFRQWGVEDAIRRRGLPENVEPAIVVESVAGPELGRVVPEPRNREATPSWTCHVTQDIVEEELASAVQSLDLVDLRFGHRVTALSQDDRIVTLTIAGPDGSEAAVEADYVVAADGAGSDVRKWLGIEMVGPSTLGVWANDFWEGDLSDILDGRSTVSFVVVPPETDSPTSMLFPSGSDRYLTWTQLGPEEAEDPSLWTSERVTAAIRKQIGSHDPDIKLLGQAVWRMSSQIAQSFRSGRVLLAGDAAHRFPPTGGLGMNTGVQDAHNLAWKLAFVLNGIAPDALLDTYQVERHAIAQDNADWSVGNATRINELVAGVRSRDEDRIAFWLRDMEHHIHQSGRALGFEYHEGALVGDGSSVTPLNSRTYQPSDRPGARFPHLWLDLSRQQSTLDWFDTDLTLVAGPDGHEWENAASKASANLSIPITYRRAPWSAPASPLGMGPRGATLVRPDGHVAWRTSWMGDDPVAMLTTAVEEVLGLARGAS
ncbi:FAD-dependent monooxygenase [Aeromicrobium panaciterrae]|uniref:FAD-dependent monooxygenase n=1 Tax=Aeromicrobium panaciterrae TaxID=363861 RepID=UPI0031DB1752